MQQILKVNRISFGWPIESIVLPVELMQQYKSSDFQTQDEYHEWQTRNLKILEVGLLLHPRIPLDKKELHARQLSEIIFGAYECPMVTGKDSEEVETLRAVALPLALRSFYGDGSDTGRWDSIKYSVIPVATLHSCYGQQVKAFTSKINDLIPLIAANKLEKCLVQMAVEASFNTEDGGQSII
ncbi:protein unc-13 [Tanacetum coccineum]